MARQVIRDTAPIWVMLLIVAVVVLLTNAVFPMEEGRDYVTHDGVRCLIRSGLCLGA